MLRRLVEASLLGISALALLVSLSILHVRLPAGRRAAGRLIETLAHDEIAGELRLGSIDSLATDRLVLRNVVLADAEGRPVLRAARAEGRIDLGALWERRIRVVDLAIRRPRAFLIEGDRGIPTLVRALEPRVRRPPTAGPPPFVVELDNAYVRDGRVEGSVAGGVGVDIRQIDGRVSFVIDGTAPQVGLAWSRMKLLSPLPPRAAAADLHLAGSAVLRGPQKGDAGQMPTRIDARGELSWRGGLAQLRFGLDGSRLTMGVSLPRPTTADAVRAILPGYPFSGGLGGWAVANGSFEELEVSTEADLGGAGVAARGTLRLKEAPGRGPGYDLAIAIANLEPSRLLPGLPGPIRTGARGRLQGHGVVPEILEARFDGALDPSVVLGYPIPGGEVHARFAGGRLEVERFDARGGGLAGVVRGEIGLDGSVDLAARLQASDMRLVHGLEPVGGTGRCDASLTGGAGRAFRLHGHGSARSLVLGPLHASTVEGQWDVRLPVAPGEGAPAPPLRMKVRAAATDASFAGVPLGAVGVNGVGDHLSIRATGSALRGERSVAVDAVVRPVLDEDGADLAFSRLEAGFRGRVFRGDGTVRVRPGRIELENLSLGRADGARVEVSGSVAPGRRIDLRASASRVDLAELWEIWTGERPPFEGRGDVRLALRGALPEPSVDLSARIGDASFGGLDGLGLVAELAHGDDRLSGELELFSGGRQVLALSGSCPVDPWAPGGPSFDVEGSREVQIRASELRVEDVLALARRLDPTVSASETDLAGAVSGTLELLGSWHEPRGTLVATISSARWGSVDDLGLGIRSEHDPAGLRLEVALSRRGRRVVGVAGTAGVVVEQSRAKLFPSIEELRGAPLELTLGFGPIDQSVLPDGWNTSPAIEASLSGHGTLRGSLADPAFHADLALGGVAHAALPWRGAADGTAHVSLVAGKLRVQGARFAREGRPLVEIDGWADLATATSGTPGSVLTPFQAAARFPDLPLAWILALDGIPVGGRVALDLSASGTLESPELSARAVLRDLVVSGTRYESATATATWEGGMLDARASLRQSSGGTLAVDARLPTRWDPTPASLAVLPEASSPLRGRIDAARFELDGLGAFVPSLAVLGGRVDAHVAVAGTRAEPTLRGTVGASSGIFELADVGQRLEDISFTLLLEPHRAVLSELRVRDRQGTAKATGEAVVEGLLPGKFELEVEGRRFPVVREGLTLADVSGRVLVEGDVTRDGIDATVTPRGLTLALPNRSGRELQPLDDHPDIDVRSSFEDRRAGPSPGLGVARGSIRETRSTFLITALFDMASNVWLTRNDLALGFDGHVIARYPWGRQLALQGSVSVRRGFVTYGKNRFDLQRGDVTFTGQPGFDPLLDVDASYENPQATVSLHAGGRFSRPILNFAAEGLSQTQIMMLLLVGQTELGGTTDDRTLAAQAQEQTQSLLTGLGISLLQQRAREAIPEWFPNIVIEQGASGLDTTRVRAGAQLGGDVYLQGSVNPGATSEENQYEVRGEWRVSRRWAIDTFLGDRGAGGVDFLWSYSY